MEVSRSKLANDFVHAQAAVDAKKKNSEVRRDAVRASLKEVERELHNIMILERQLPADRDAAEANGRFRYRHRSVGVAAVSLQSGYC